MSWFKRRSQVEKPRSVRSAIEPLESRAYFSAVPATVTVTVPGPIPGPTVAGLIVHDKIGVNLANNDAGSAKGKVTIALFASTDTTLDGGDAQIQLPKSYAVNIPAGKSKTIKIDVKSFPQNLSGSYYILAEATGSAVNQAVGSSTTTASVQQAEIDLSGTVTKTPLKGKAGKKIPVTVSVSNAGNTLAKGTLVVGFSLSATPDGLSPISLGSLPKHIALKPGKSTVIHFNVPLALGVPTGNEYVVANVDPSNAFLDPNLVNNVNVGQQAVSIT